ncbi:hypothetical protein [Bacillus pseudomycoides]|uniref:hypothetical protein n=1 Tax=Bacillus pseudomycoides TaxID=64104 RepID=UPI0020D24A84|nr:hypothetical protein [Bacillus pseudomycoides]
MIQLTVKGQPSHIRHLAHDPEYLFAIEFHDVTKQMTSINKEEQSVKVTALIHPEQWNQLLQMIAEAGDSLANANEIIMEGTMDHTPEEVYTFAPGHIKYRSHLQQKQEEKEAEIREEKETRIASKTKSTVSKRIEQLHAKYDGVCQKCGQRCDKRVVSIKKIQSKMGIVCPDCKNGTTFLIREVKGELQQELLQRDLFSTKQEILSYFQEFCSQFALVNHQETYRMYWSWDKKQLCREVHISKEGTVYKVRLNEGDDAFLQNSLLKLPLKKIHFRCTIHPQKCGWTESGHCLMHKKQVLKRQKSKSKFIAMRLLRCSQKKSLLNVQIILDDIKYCLDTQPIKLQRS